jgi:NAD+ diphosphatase
VVAAHAFAGNALDRSHNLKTAAAGAEAAASPGARFIIVHSKRALCRIENSSAVRLPLAAILAAAELGIAAAAHLFEPSCPCLCVLLGLGPASDSLSPQWVFALNISSAFSDDATAIAALAAASDLSASSTLAFTATRALLSTIGGAELAVVGQATALLEWNRTTRFCGACGSPTVSIECGLKRQCSKAECRSRLYPRTDPVAIALVIDVASGRALLGRSKNFRANMYSTLAGFVEQGESLEEAVRREVSEEAGIACGRCIYHSSQPWPIGRGGGNELMVGFIVEALSVDIAVDPNELEDARWFTRDEVRAASQWTGASAAAAAPESSGIMPFSIPGSYAIAHHLIQHWLDTPLEQLSRAFRD